MNLINHNTFLLRGKKYKSVLLYEENLLLSSKPHKTYDTFPKNKKEKGLIESLEIVRLDSVTQLYFNEKSLELVLLYTNKKEKSKKLVLEFEKDSARVKLVNGISAIKNFSKSTSVENKFKPLFFGLGYVSIACGITWTLFTMAQDIEKGIPFVASGRRAAMRELLHELAGALGVYGVLFMGGIALVALLNRIISRFLKPANDIVYK